jgi:hypothetical protein
MPIAIGMMMIYAQRLRSAAGPNSQHDAGQFGVPKTIGH